MYPLPCLFACDRPYPEPEGKDGRSGQPPVGTINVVAEQPSQPVARHNAIADTEASTHPNGHSTTARSTRALHGHGHRTSHGIQASTSSPGEADKQPASAPRLHQSMPPAHRCATPHSKLHCRIPTGGLREHAPPRLALGAQARPRSLARKGRENFSEEHRAPFGKLRRIRVSLSPLR